MKANAFSYAEKVLSGAVKYPSKGYLVRILVRNLYYGENRNCGRLDKDMKICHWILIPTYLTR